MDPIHNKSGTQISDFEILCEMLDVKADEHGKCMGDVYVSDRAIDIGYNLSYQNQQIIHTNVRGIKEKLALMEDGLYIVRVDGVRKGCC